VRGRSSCKLEDRGGRRSGISFEQSNLGNLYGPNANRTNSKLEVTRSEAGGGEESRITKGFWGRGKSDIKNVCKKAKANSCGGGTTYDRKLKETSGEGKASLP